MALSEFEIKRIEKIMASYLETIRPPIDQRAKLDYKYQIVGQSVTLLEFSPRWDDPSTILEIPIAKATYIKSKKHWKIFWPRRDRRWHSYQPEPISMNIEGFIEIIKTDTYGCFFG